MIGDLCGNCRGNGVVRLFDVNGKVNGTAECPACQGFGRDIGTGATTIDNYQQQCTRTEGDYAVAAARLQDLRTVRLLHAALGLCTEAAEFADILKKHIFYGKPLDVVHLKEELGDGTWYGGIACEALEAKLIDILRRTIEKLRVRYPDAFTEAKALIRDLDAERAVLEGK